MDILLEEARQWGFETYDDLVMYQQRHVNYVVAKKDDDYYWADNRVCMEKAFIDANWRHLALRYGPVVMIGRTTKQLTTDVLLSAIRNSFAVDAIMAFVQEIDIEAEANR
jgi:hypothetical protein